MTSSTILRKIVPACCMAIAMGILVRQHISNTKDVMLRADKANSMVLELFTSQGCSSSPPADELLAALQNKPNVITLAYHVDYWNKLGWQDTYSSQKHNDYQASYATKFKVNAYTPEMVVNGRKEFIGSNKRVLTQVLKSNSRVKTLSTPQVARTATSIAVSYNIAPLEKGTTLYAILVLDSDRVYINAGENKHKSINYVNIVLDKVILNASEQTGFYTFPMPAGALPHQKFKVVLLTQDKDMTVKAVSVSKSC